MRIYLLIHKKKALYIKIVIEWLKYRGVSPKFMVVRADEL